MGEIDDYLAGLDEPERASLERIRDIALQVAPDAVQDKSYGMPALRVAGELPGFSLSKGTIRFTPATPIPDHVVERLVRLRLAEITGS